MLYLNGNGVNVGHFPNHESFADIRKSVLKQDKNVIGLFFESDEDILFLQFLKDFVDEYAPQSYTVLEMPYIPYSRMDRQEEDRLFTLRSFAKMVNRMNFQKVIVWEPHSEVSTALIERVQVIDTSILLAKKAMMDVLGLVGSAWLKPSLYPASNTCEDFTLEGLLSQAEKKGIYLVYPDAGAEKRYKKQIKYPNIITCSKVRDFNTGNIQSITVNNPESAANCKIAIIVDDLCSKGGTFVGSAKALKEAIPTLEKVILVVTHCEKTILDGVILTGDDISSVYTTTSIFTDFEDYSVINGNIPGTQRYEVGKMIIEPKGWLNSYVSHYMD